MIHGGESTRSPSMRSIKRILISVTTSVGLVYLGLLLLVYLSQAHFIFFPTTDLLTTPAAYQWDYEDIKLSVNGESTHGWFIPASKTARGTILFSHGNAGNIGGRLETIHIFRELGFNTLIYDYGGYGKSTGSPSEDRCYADIRAMWDELTKSRNIPPSQIILFGRSLGGGATSQLATEVTPAAVVLESTFTSIADMAQDQFPLFPTRLLVKHRFDTLEKVPHIDVPILHIHSPDDTLIPYTHGQQLFRASTEPKQFLEIRGDHNEGFWLSADAYTEGLDDFFTQHLPEPNS